MPGTEQMWQGPMNSKFISGKTGGKEGRKGEEYSGLSPGLLEGSKLCNSESENGEDNGPLCPSHLGQ
jgi:hypothetical protein